MKIKRNKSKAPFQRSQISFRKAQEAGRTNKRHQHCEDAFAWTPLDLCLDAARLLPGRRRDAARLFAWTPPGRRSTFAWTPPGRRSTFAWTPPGYCSTFAWKQLDLCLDAAGTPLDLCLDDAGTPLDLCLDAAGTPLDLCLDAAGTPLRFRDIIKGEIKKKKDRKCKCQKKNMQVTKGKKHFQTKKSTVLNGSKFALGRRWKAFFSRHKVQPGNPRKMQENAKKKNTSIQQKMQNGPKCK